MTLCPYRAGWELVAAVMFYLSSSAVPMRINGHLSLINIEDELVKWLKIFGA